VATRLDEIVGFVIGSVDRRANVAWIIQHHRPELLRAGIRALATRPAVAAHFLRTRCLRYLRRLVSRGGPGASSAATGESPEAQSMQSGVLEAVVAPEVRGKSIGTALVENFLAIVAAAGVERVELPLRPARPVRPGSTSAVAGGWSAVTWTATVTWS
jgi:GNAT superfamily N-acetyltransferase